ncbi:MAG: hypothetical protein ACREFY_02880, partial [Acetobacteraceae bacterium]
GRAPAGPSGRRRIYLDGRPGGRPGGWRAAPVFDFAALAPGQALAGPAIVESDTTTVLLRDGEAGRLAPMGWLEISVGPW